MPILRQPPHNKHLGADAPTRRRPGFAGTLQRCLAPRRPLAIVLVSLIGLGAAEAQDASNRLQETERALDRSRDEAARLERRATELRSQSQTLRRDMVAAAAIIQNHEADIARLDADIGGLSNALEQRRTALGNERVRFAQVLLALQRIARHPPEALIVQPISPDDMVRGAILLRAAVPAIEQRAASLRSELDSLTELRRSLERRRLERDEAGRALERDRQRLVALLVKREGESAVAVAEYERASARTQALAGEAKDLKELMDRLEAERRQGEVPARRSGQEQARLDVERNQGGAVLGSPRTVSIRPGPADSDHPPISKARGRLPFPAVGDIVAQFGEPTDNGLSRKGISLRTRWEAQVVAPYDGQVAYAGIFRGYGLLLIIDHGEGYHSLLTGMARIDAALGQRVLAGEPVGVMGLPTADPPILYVELRHDGQPINPLPWLAARNGKISG